jgi:hypothetical protein
LTTEKILVRAASMLFIELHNCWCSFHLRSISNIWNGEEKFSRV